MGKQVQVNSDYSTVLLADGQPHEDGDIVDLTDAEYDDLEPWAEVALTLLGTVLDDPVRAPSDVQTVVVADESDGHYYKIIVDAGTLDTEQIT